MQWLGVSYSVWFNKKHDRCGNVFQGRFKSFVIEDERYFAALILYVHGNPVRAKLGEGVGGTQVEQLQGLFEERVARSLADDGYGVVGVRGKSKEV